MLKRALRFAPLSCREPTRFPYFEMPEYGDLFQHPADVQKRELGFGEDFHGVPLAVSLEKHGRGGEGTDRMIVRTTGHCTEGWKKR